MGNHLTPPTLQDYALHDLPHNLSLDDDPVMDKSRFLKTIKCFNDEGKIIVKVYIKHRAVDEKLITEHEKTLEKISTIVKLIKLANVLPFHVFVHTEKAGYMLRQYFHNNLYDRISTRPFLMDIEKLWLTYQLSCAVAKCHIYGIIHGDLKCENALVTSWNWLFLSDFAPYKPVFIPEDNNYEFDYYFDSMTRRKCYLAPERFYPGTKKPSEANLAAMDVFSLGCVIAELWLEGKPLFTYSQLLSYKKGTYDPLPRLNDIKNEYLKDLIVACINKDPALRPSAEFNKWKRDLFPPYFEFLHSYIFGVMKSHPDQVVSRIHRDLPALHKQVAENGEFSREAALLLIGGLDTSSVLPAGPPRSGPAFVGTPTKESLLGIVGPNPSTTQLDLFDSLFQQPLPVGIPKGQITVEDISKSVSPNSFDPFGQFSSQQPQAPTISISPTPKPNSSLRDHKIPSQPGSPGPGDARDSFSPRAISPETLPPQRPTLSPQAISPEGISPSTFTDHTNSSQSGESVSPNQAILSPRRKKPKLDQTTIRVRSDSNASTPSSFNNNLYEDKLRPKNINPATDSPASISPTFLPAESLAGASSDSLQGVANIKRTATFREITLKGFNLPQPLRFQPPKQIGGPEFKAYVIIFDLLSSMVRNVKDCGVKLKFLDCLDWIAPHVDNSCLLQRLVPYLVSILNENTNDVPAAVISRALKSLTRAIEMVATVPISEAGFFPEYILPILYKFVSPFETPSELIRLTLAECVPSLADMSRRFLELSIVSAEKSNTKQTTYQGKVAFLRTTFKEVVEKLLAVESPRSIKIALVSKISSLADFFGQEKTNEVLLPLLISCLNARDTDLKIAFFRNIVGLSAVAGPKSMEQFIVSCVLPEIYEKREDIVFEAVQSLTQFAQVQNLRKTVLFNIAREVAPLLLHPNSWIRFSTVSLFVAISENFSELDLAEGLIPILKPFLTREIVEFTQTQLLSSLHPYLTRKTFLRALSAPYSEVKAEVNHFNSAPTILEVASTIGNLRELLNEIGRGEKDLDVLQNIQKALATETLSPRSAQKASSSPIPKTTSGNLAMSPLSSPQKPGKPIPVVNLQASSKKSVASSVPGKPSVPQMIRSGSGVIPSSSYMGPGGTGMMAASLSTSSLFASSPTQPRLSSTPRKATGARPPAPGGNLGTTPPVLPDFAAVRERLAKEDGKGNPPKKTNPPPGTSLPFILLHCQLATPR